MRVEFKKNKHGYLFFLLPIGIIINTLFLFYKVPNNADAWKTVLFSIPVLNTLIISVFMTVIASGCIDIENKANMCNLLPTLESRRNIYLYKLLYGFLHLFLFCFIQMSLVILLGSQLLPQNPIPWAYLIQLFFGELISGMIIFQVQCLFSMRFSGQFLALSIGFGGTLTGFLLGLVTKYALTPWSVLFSLSAVTMDYNQAEQKMFLYFRSVTMGEILISLLYLVVTFLLGLYVFSKNEGGRLFISQHRKSRSLYTGLPVEIIKLKYNPVWIPFIIIPVISAGIGTVNFLANQGVLSFTRDSLWTQQSLFLGIFFLSPLIGILAGMLWRMEHQRGNFNIMLTVTSGVKLIKDKWLTASLLSIMCMVWISIIFIVSGNILGISENVPIEFYYRILAGSLCIIAVAGIQCMLSLIFSSFALPVVIAFFGNISGLVLTVKGFYYATPFSCLIYSMGSTAIKGSINIPAIILSCFIYIFASLGISILFIRRRYYTA